MKRTDSRDWLAVVKQLFGYLRRILHEQLDRRFVFGLTLGPDMMTVWLHDRSGVIGTKTAIDITRFVNRDLTNGLNIKTLLPAGPGRIHPSNRLFLSFVT